MRVVSTPQIGVELFGFAEQVGDMFVGRLDQALQLPQLILEILAKLALLVVTPGLFELVHLGRERSTALPQFLRELSQLARELPDLVGVADRLIHDADAGVEGDAGVIGEWWLDRMTDASVV